MYQTTDGEWIDVSFRPVVICCGCGLAHNEEYRIITSDNGEKSILRRSAVNNKQTGYARSSMKAKKEGVYAKKRKGKK